MKKSTLLLIAFLAVILVSCTKSNDLLAPLSDNGSKIEFSLHNDLKTFVDVYGIASLAANENAYVFSGVNSEFSFSLGFMTDSLRPGSYNVSVNSGVVVLNDGRNGITNAYSNDFVVNITSNVNGLVNGSFSGTLYNQTTKSNCSVVEGKIQNIQLFYR